MAANTDFMNAKFTSKDVIYIIGLVVAIVVNYSTTQSRIALLERANEQHDKTIEKLQEKMDADSKDIQKANDRIFELLKSLKNEQVSEVK
jgi:hypothetical protein